MAQITKETVQRRIRSLEVEYANKSAEANQILGAINEYSHILAFLEKPEPTPPSAPTPAEPAKKEG